MGLNIGIEVEHQDDSYGAGGRNPQGTPEEVEARFFAFLRERFPEGGFGMGWVHLRPQYNGERWWDFDVRMFGYGSEFRQDQTVMYLAIYEFILSEFATTDGGLVTRAYWSG